MSGVERRQANCRFCGYLCGLIATVIDGRVVDVEPDPSRYPYDASIQRGCLRWKANLEFLDHPLRVNFPLKRVGERGSGEWQRVTWEAALEDIAARLQGLKDRFGAETLATSIGGPHATYWPLHRFMNLFGSPNNMGIGPICWNPGIWVNTLSYGWPVENELDIEKTSCAMLWGTNLAESDNSLFWRTLVQFRREGKPIIVVDPRRTRTAAQADIWLPVRPGTDPVLALGLLHIILTENLYDSWFVQTWCHGFERLCEHVTPYTPAVVEKITGVEAEKLLAVAHLYALHAPATLITGRGIDQLGQNTVPTHRLLAILRAVTGNVDVPGASHLCEMPDFIPEVDLELNEALDETQASKHLNRDHLFLHSYPGYERIEEYTKLAGRRLPKRYLTSVHPDLLWNAVLTGEPYPLRAMIVMGSNPLLTQAGTQRIYQALKSLDLLVALEYFKTPTAMLADYILPIAGGLERPLFQTHAGTANIAYGGDQAMEPYYERQTDFYFWKELGKRMGQGAYWPWETFQQSLEEILAKAGVSWQEYGESGLYYAPGSYQKHELVNKTSGQKNSFATPSRKVELYSEILAQAGYDGLPVPVSLPALKPGHLWLISGARKQPYYASSYRQLKTLRDAHPEPLAEMDPVTAERLGLKDGDKLCVETENGRARFVLKTSQMREDVISVEYGWWFPEMPACEPELGGLWLSNANLLTNVDIKTSDPLIGTWVYNGLQCRVTPVETGEM